MYTNMHTIFIVSKRKLARQERSENWMCVLEHARSVCVVPSGLEVYKTLIDLRLMANG